MFSNDIEVRRISLAVAVVAALLWIVVFSAARFGAKSGALSALRESARDRRKGILRLPTKPS